MRRNALRELRICMLFLCNLNNPRASDNPIYVQIGGDNPGFLRGLPKKIDQKVLTTLKQIADGEAPIIPVIRTPRRVNSRDESESRSPLQITDLPVRMIYF